jgi:hypothetical protein
VPIAEIRIDASLWDAASELRRQEWRTLIADLLDEGPIAPTSPAHRMIVRSEKQGIVIELVGDRDIAIHDAVLRAHLDEYLAIIKKMVEDDVPAPRMEALDMAKKVVHDRAGAALAREAAHLGERHEAFRRLFSLLVALKIDTTSLPIAHRHRL